MTYGEGTPIPQRSLEKFLGALGERTPSPGGGAVAALSGAMGAAQLLMIAEYAKWESGGPDPRARLKELSSQLLKLAQEDAVVYGAYTRAKARRKEDPAAYAEAQQAIADVPLNILERCLEAFGMVADVLRRAPSWFGCDVSIVAGCLETGASGARSLCGANLRSLAAPAAQRLAGRLAELEREQERTRRTLEPLLLSRLPAK